MRNSVGKHVLEKKKSASCAPRGRFYLNSILNCLICVYLNLFTLENKALVINFTGVMQVTNIGCVYQYQLSISIVPFHFSAILCNAFGTEKIENSVKAALQQNINCN